MINYKLITLRSQERACMRALNQHTITCAVCTARRLSKRGPMPRCAERAVCESELLIARRRRLMAELGWTTQIKSTNAPAA